MSGAAFKQLRTSYVPKDLVGFNAAWFITRTGENQNYNIAEDLIPGKKVFLLGSYEKPVSGDIDIGVDWGVEQPTDIEIWEWAEHWFINKLKIPKQHLKIVKGWNQIHCLVPLMNNQTGKPVMGCYQKDGSFIQSDVPGMIQIDLLFGNRQWMQSVLSGPSLDTKYKASYRTNLLAEIVSAINWKVGNINHKFSFDYKFGVFHKTFRVKPPTGKQKIDQIEQISRKLMFNDPDILAKTLFGIQYTWEDIDSYEKITQFINTRTGQYWNCYNLAQQEFVSRLVKENLPVPEDLRWLIPRVV